MSPYRPLQTTRAAGDYQRDWAKSLRAGLAGGTPYAFVNADTPHELFHAMDVPIVTNQWWSAVIAAKQLSPYYFDRMSAMGYHDRLARYSSLPLIAELDGDAERQPWGGLPPPALLCARLSADDHGRIFSAWAERTGARLHLFSAPASPDPVPDWWLHARNDWETLYGTDRLDLMVAEMEELIALIEARFDRRFDPARLATLMADIETQETLFEEASTLIAAAPRCPIRIAEQIPNIMIPQWHRGSPWAVAHASAFRDEVAERVREGSAVCENERIRMMWIGAGLWFDTSFYSAFEESHGAVFAWSMYLPFACDGYIRHDHGDPMRALAARICSMNEQLHQPPWAGAWLVEQARRYRIDVALMLIPEHDRPSGQGSLFIRRALEDAGIAVIDIWSDMVDPRTWNRDEMVAKVSGALERLA